MYEPIDWKKPIEIKYQARWWPGEVVYKTDIEICVKFELYGEPYLAVFFDGESTDSHGEHEVRNKPKTLVTKKLWVNPHDLYGLGYPPNSPGAVEITYQIEE